jgi:hypothetical protein
MTVDELDQLERDVEDVAHRRGSETCIDAAAVEENVALFRQLVSLAREDLGRGSEVGPRLSSGLRALATILLELASDREDGGSAGPASAAGGGRLGSRRLQR